MRVFALLVVLAMLLSAVVAGTASATHSEEGDVDLWLTVLHNNDGESDVFPDEVLDDEDNLIGLEKGVAYFATTLKQARTEANKKTKGDNTKRGTLVVSSGQLPGEPGVHGESGRRHLLRRHRHGFVQLRRRRAG